MPMNIWILPGIYLMSKVEMPMKKILLKKIQLENFKCYKKATINFKELTVIVGENNAGKSCLIEALRLVSRAAQGSKKRVYTSAPVEMDLPLSIKGFPIDTQKLRIDLGIIIYYYDTEKYAKISAYFSDKSKIEIYLNTKHAFAVIYNDNQIVKNKQQAEKLHLDKIGILPQIGPIRENEKMLSYETVLSDKDTYLSSLHFRNEIYLWKKDFYDHFKRNAEETWPGLKIKSLEFNPVYDEYISLMVQDNNFPAEIGKMGNGLQMWLQIIWFLARSKDAGVIILDEPDVYMHSDMQRKVLELVKAQFPQVIIATHSLEIISRVEPDCILEINKKDKTMQYASDYTSAQKIIDDIGGVQNLSLINLGRQRRCLFVEGKDLNYLNKFNECICGKQLHIPTFTFGGFNNIPHIYGAANLFFSETSNQIKCFALADRDYRDERVIEKVCSDAEKEHLILHVWNRKEIENYFIEPSILYTFIPSKYNVSYDDFLVMIDALIEEQKTAVFDSYATQYRIDCKFLDNGQQWDVATCNQHAREFLRTHWTTRENKISLIGGKNFLSVLSDYFQRNYQVALSPRKIIEKFTAETIPVEIKVFLEQLQLNR